MNVLYITYPELFKCRGKFERKVKKIVSRMGGFKVVYLADYHSFISGFCQDENIDHEKISELDNSCVTHAIVFDDGEEFPDIVKWLNDHNVKMRLIRIPITRVVNIRKKNEYNGPKSTDTYEYIGRGSYWGNPYAIGENGDDRAEVIRKFKYDFDYEKFPTKEKSEVIKLAGKRLGCFCKPEVCHGDVLADYLNSYDDGK